MTDAPSPLFGNAIRQPPANLEAEAALLGGLLANNSAYDRVASFLRAEHFVGEDNGRLYAAIERRIMAGQVADAVTLQTEFDREYLASLLVAMVAPMLCGEYGQPVMDCFLRRQLCDMATEIDRAARGDDAGCDAPDLIAAAQDRLAALAEEGDSTTTARGPTTLANAVASAIERAEAMHRGEEAPGPEHGHRAGRQRLWPVPATGDAELSRWARRGRQDDAGAPDRRERGARRDGAMATRRPARPVPWRAVLQLRHDGEADRCAIGGAAWRGADAGAAQR